MSISPTIQKNESENSERRSGSREPLKWVVLVYFGQDNWGKLVDLSESGMRFEFAQPPADRERVNFTLEAMGRLPAPFGGEIISDSFQASGDVRWTRDFERIAGVQFVSLDEGSRERIRKWLSFEASAVTTSAGNKWEQEEPAPLPSPHEPLSDSPETLPAIYEENLPLDAEPGVSRGEALPDPASPLVEKILEAPGFQAYSKLMAEEEKKLAETPVPNPRMSRSQVMAVSVGLAAVILIGGAAIILPRFGHKVPAADPNPISTTGDRDPAGAEYASAAGGQHPFLVEVLDANNRRWLLWFDGNSPKNAPTQAAYKSPLSASPSPSPSKAASRPKQPVVSAKPAAPHNFTLIAPKPIRPEANNSAANSASLAAPVVRDDLRAPAEAPIASPLANRAPSPVAEPAPIGGQVEMARLLRSVPPVYPPIARSSRVGGDVTLDALIDANGNVAELKVVSGPTVLRQPAVDAVRQWKYEPARLNGRPVPIHLSVTLKFHFL